MTVTRTVDAVVIGGGLAGTSTALALRRHGMSVALLDRFYCGAQASGVNYGGVRRQGRPLAQLPLSQRAHTIWPRLAAVIGIDGEYIRSGHLKLAATEAGMAALEAYEDAARPFGLGLELLGRNALTERFGWLGGTIVGASLCPDDGHANPRLVAAGFAAAARRAGVEIHELTPVTGFARRGTEGFAIEAGTLGLQARHLVNAAGAWADSFAALAGEPVPMTRIYPSMVVTEPLPPILDVNIGMEGGGIYARQVERGNCIVGGMRGSALPDPDFSRPTTLGARTIMARMGEYVPTLRHALAIRFWSGTEAAMPDSNPVIGPSRTMPGLWHVFGFSGAGFQITPAAGEVLAELIVSGRSTTPIEAFDIARFTRAPSQPQPALSGINDRGVLT